MARSKSTHAKDAGAYGWSFRRDTFNSAEAKVSDLIASVRDLPKRTNGSIVLPPLKLLRTLFQYSEESPSGLVWRVNRSGATKAGDVAGCLDAYGYWTAAIGNRKFKVHRIIFRLFNTKEPELIDHIDGNPGNNKVSNLRAAHKAVNSFNRGLRKDNKTGYTGVQWYENLQKYIGRVRRKHIGCFTTIEEAVTAVAAYHKENGSSQWLPTALTQRSTHERHTVSTIS